MKLFKKVVLLSLVILSVGSSVAFGCQAEQSASVAIDTGKVTEQSTLSSDAPGGTKANSGEQQPVLPH